MKKPKNPVRSTRSWSWSGEGIMKQWGEAGASNEHCHVWLNTPVRLRNYVPRKVRVLVKVTEVRR